MKTENQKQLLLKKAPVVEQYLNPQYEHETFIGY